MKPKIYYQHFKEYDNKHEEINYNEFNELLEEGHSDEEISKELNLSKSSLIKLSEEDGYKVIWFSRA